MISTAEGHDERIAARRREGFTTLDYVPVEGMKQRKNSCVCDGGAYAHGARAITAVCPWCDAVVSGQVCRLWPISCTVCPHCDGRIEFTGRIPNAR